MKEPGYKNKGRAALLKSLGLSAPVTKAQIKAGWKRDAKQLPKETRQAVLDGLHAGQTVGEVREALGLTLEEVSGVILLNTETVTMKHLRRETV